MANPILNSSPLQGYILRNNVAQQAVHFVVMPRMITLDTHRIKGRPTNERLRSVIARCRLQERLVWEFILKAV